MVLSVVGICTEDSAYRLVPTPDVVTSQRHWSALLAAPGGLGSKTASRSASKYPRVPSAKLPARTYPAALPSWVWLTTTWLPSSCLSKAEAICTNVANTSKKEQRLREKLSKERRRRRPYMSLTYTV